ncbi:MAG: beta-galactosidase trimerization domain-containing protein [Capsulimonadaceae bacterium]|nr:beta-galactosidase trimerization domain-containing protein [Capsulimonadaceae bacterium]
MDRLRFRQIHLDFHTSEAIAGIGKDWDKRHFQEMLKLGRVNSINIFAKCHHGWAYYPTKTPLAAVHPGLDFNLLGEMIEACHEIDVKCPVYLSAGLDQQMAVRHPEWLRRTKEGSTNWVTWMQAGYQEFCMRSPYLDYLTEQTVEVARDYNTDGIWLDIVGVRDCACQTCINEMRKRGLDPRDDASRRLLGRETFLNYAHRINDAIHAVDPKLPVVHNSGHITRGDRELMAIQTHFELESLPTGGWGYDHFPLSARYVHGVDNREFLGMSGKFHTTWGEFGGYKHPNALRYEASLCLANGGKFCVGDQMHPYGRLDRATYQLVGQAYEEVETKEPWCWGVRSIADAGVLSVQAIQGQSLNAKDQDGDEGAVRVLRQIGVTYDVIDAEFDFNKYKVIILPDAIPVTGALQGKLTAYLKAGGKILATGSSALDSETGEFALPLGVRGKGVTAFSPEYLVPRFELNNWAEAAFVIYSPMQDIDALPGAEVLAVRQDPFFNRDYLHFCSHQHAPSTQIDAGPAIVATSNTAYIAFPAFALYREKGQNVLREIIEHALRLLLPEPSLRTSLPGQGVATAMRQASENRTVVHVLYGSPVRRAANIEVIEDLIPILDTAIALRTPKRPSRVYLAPQGTDLPFTYESGTASTTVPKFECHQMVVFED